MNKNKKRNYNNKAQEGYKPFVFFSNNNIIFRVNQNKRKFGEMILSDEEPEEREVFLEVEKTWNTGFAVMYVTDTHT
jgi:hypothetical protein